MASGQTVNPGVHWRLQESLAEAWVGGGLLQVWGQSAAVCAWNLLKELAIVFITSTIVWPQVKPQGGNRARPSTENWIKDLLNMAPPIRTDPVSLSVSFSHQESFITSYLSPSEGRENENHNHRKLNKLITRTTALSNSKKR